MKSLAFLLAYLVSSFMFCQEKDSLKTKEVLRTIDSIKYSEKDFNTFKNKLTESKYILDALPKK